MTPIGDDDEDTLLSLRSKSLKCESGLDLHTREKCLSCYSMNMSENPEYTTNDS